jgi:hypothetical protein
MTRTYHLYVAVGVLFLVVVVDFLVVVVDFLVVVVDFLVESVVLLTELDFVVVVVVNDVLPVLLLLLVGVDVDAELLEHSWKYWLFTVHVPS